MAHIYMRIIIIELGNCLNRAGNESIDWSVLSIVEVCDCYIEWLNKLNILLQIYLLIFFRRRVAWLSHMIWLVIELTSETVNSD